MLRFAPSPATDLSVGALHIAIANWIVSRQQETGFILRIDATDEESSLESHDAQTRQILEKFALPHDHLLYQSESLHRHQQLAVSLLEQGKAFVCTCTPEEIEADQAAAKSAGRPYRYSGRCAKHDAEDLRRIKEENTPYVIRIHAPQASIAFDDTVQGRIVTPPEAIDCFVLVGTEGTPTHDFACAVDDMLSGITTVIQETIHLSSVPRQIHIRHQLGYDLPIAYAHLPTLQTPEEVGSLKHLLEAGFLPDAILNHLIALNIPTPTEVFTLPEAIEWFDLHRLSSSEATFDLDTLRSLNREHLRRMDDKAASALYGFADADVGRLVKLHLSEAATLQELDAKIKPIFAPKPCEGEWAETMKRIAAQIPNMPMFKTFAAFSAHIAAHVDLSEATLLTPLRLLLTGAHHGPDLGEIYPLIRSYITEVARCPH